MAQRIRRRTEPQSRGTSRANRHPHGASSAATANRRGPSDAARARATAGPSSAASSSTNPADEPRGALGDAAQGPSTHGTLGSGYSSGSSTGGTGGGVLEPRGSGYSPGADSRTGAAPNESDALAIEGVAAGAAGVRRRTVLSRFKPGASGDQEEDEGMDGGATVVGVSGVSGGGRGTTSSGNTRR